MIILRFSDYEAETINAHLGMIRDQGTVWWAWWKKVHEPMRLDLLDDLVSALSTGPAEIALVDRVDRQMCVATCESLVFSSDGTPRPSPDDELVPSYYRGRPFPAWFRLTEIKRISEETWTNKYGRVPSGDSTIYAPKSPRPDIESHLIEVDSPDGHDGVLHISDLHFGDDHGHPLVSSGPFNRPTLMTRLLSALPKRPACVVVSGDLTTQGNDAGLRSARLFLEDLASQLEIPRECIVIAPGNHDILIDDEELTRDFSNEQPFRDLLNLFYGQGTPIERVQDIRDPQGRHYVIGVLNSSRPRHKSTMDYGYVGRDRSEPVFNSVGQVLARSREAAWGAMVMHHHVLPAQLVEVPEEGHKRPVSLCLDAGELLSLAQSTGVSTILHGHQHLPFSATVARRAEFSERGAVLHPDGAVSVLASGSAGVKQARIPAELGLNTFSVYEPFETQGVLATCHAFGPAREAHELWSLVLP